MSPRNFFHFKPSISSSSSPLPPSPPRKTFSDKLIEENIETARSIITKWNNSSISTSQSPFHKTTPPLFTNTRQEAKQYLNAVMSLQSAMQYLVARDSSSDILIQAQSLMQLAINRLETEFYTILSQNRNRFDSETISANSYTARRSSVSEFDDEFSDDDDDDESRFAFTTADSVTATAMTDLKAIADCMISTGYSKECAKIYVIVRKSIVDETLYNLGVEKLSFSQVQKMDWELLEQKIKSWKNAIKVAITALFHSERILCDYVFEFDSPQRKLIADSCFAEICREGATLLFEFLENVAKCKKTPEKMFRILDLYEAISDNWKQIESIFSSESTSAIRSQVITSQLRLGDAVRLMLSDFESAIHKESSKIPLPGGGIHPLTRYVMNYIAVLADYSSAIEEIFADMPQTPLPETYYKSPSREENNTPSELVERFAWLILVVLCKVDGKAKLYKDVALSYLFLANNMQYVVVKVRKSNLGFFLGEDWLNKHELKVKEYVSKYESMGWSNVLSSLPENPTVGNPNANAIVQCFNVAFQEACRVQSSWVVPDPNLRDEIKASIASKLVKKYREFYENNRVGLFSGIRILPDDLENFLSDILCGS